jgi:hypothetical protein
MSDEQTTDELKTKLALIEAIRKEREITDKLYAIKLTETIVFGLCALILAGVVTAIVALVLR